MNKPAPKEPSMDEILSSIRQIIADDDAASAPKKAAAAAVGFAPAPPRPPIAAAPAMAAPAAMPEPEFDPAPEFDPEPEAEAEPFALSSEQILRETAVADSARPGADFDGLLEGLGAPDSVAQAAPLPDPTLTSDMAAELLEPTTQSAVQSTFARLSGLSTVSSSVTIEDMMREMLRPMLKEWLDENLPTVVERMVEQEIARVSRGNR
jgi:uncharacterized protein